MKEDVYSEVIADAIKEVLIHQNQTFDFDENEGSFAFCLAAENIDDAVICIISVQTDAYCVHTFSLDRADTANEDMVTAMARYICYVNNQQDGNYFVFNITTGSIGVVTYVECYDSAPSITQIIESIYYPMILLKEYSPGLDAVIYDKLTAKEAISRYEEAQKKEKPLALTDILPSDVLHDVYGIPFLSDEAGCINGKDSSHQDADNDNGTDTADNHDTSFNHSCARQKEDTAAIYARLARKFGVSVDELLRNDKNNTGW